MAYRRDEMWSEGRYDYERIPRERLPPRIHPDDDYHRVVNIVPKKPPLLDRPGEGSYSRYDDYGHVEYRDYEEGRSFAHERRSGPPHRGVHKDESGYRWPRDDHSISRQPEYSHTEFIDFKYAKLGNLRWSSTALHSPTFVDTNLPSEMVFTEVHGGNWWRSGSAVQQSRSALCRSCCSFW